MNHFRKIVKYWQTVLFFILVGVMVLFIYSTLRSTQYIVETEILVISDSEGNINCGYPGELGATFARIISSESFQYDVMKRSKFFDSKKLSIKHYKDSGVVRLRVRGKSPKIAGAVVEDIQETITSEIVKYYSPQNKIRIKTLMEPNVKKASSVIFVGMLFGGLGGAVIGIMIILFSGLELSLFKKAVKNREYKSIVKKRLEQELTGSVDAKLKFTDDNYDIRKKTVVGAEKSLDESDSKKDKIVREQTVTTRETNNDDRNSKDNSSNQNIERVVSKDNRRNNKITDNINVGSNPVESDPDELSINTRIASSSNKATPTSKGLQKSVVPDNLPVLGMDNTKNSSMMIEKAVKKDETIVAETSAVKDIYEDKSAETLKDELVKKVKGGDLKRSPNKTAKEKRAVINRRRGGVGNMGEVGRGKQTNAHDIANGFAPDTTGIEGPTNEEIKDRLNRLLRGDL